MRSVAARAMWLGRATVLLVGLAVILAVVVGLASTALSATGASFILGEKNSANRVTTLVKKRSGPALRLKVRRGQPPLAVSSGAKVARLNSDRLDGIDSGGFYRSGAKVADSAHADRADSATRADTSANAQNADTVGGRNASELLAGGELPSGRTLRGTYAIRWDPPAAGRSSSDTISFVYALPSEPTSVFVASGAAAPAGCPGSPSDPQADAGFLCVYEAFNVQTTNTVLCNPAQGTCGVPVTRWGGYIRTDSTGTSPGTRTTGTWAVTAP